MTNISEMIVDRVARLYDRKSFLGGVRDLALDRDGARFAYRTKGAVAAGSSTDETWAAPLATRPGGAVFIEGFEKRAALIQGNFVRVPFSTPTAFQTARPLGYRISGPTAGKPLTVAAFTTVTLEAGMVGVIIVQTKDTIRWSGRGSDAALARQLMDAVVTATNTALLDPNVTGSITDGISATPSSGTTYDALLADISALLDVGDAPTVFASLKWAVRIRATLGTGADLFKLVVAPEAGDYIIAADPLGVAVAYEGIDIDIAEAAALEMRDDPTGGPAVLVSLFQTDSVATRVEVPANWERVRADAVRVLDMSAQS